MQSARKTSHVALLAAGMLLPTIVAADDDVPVAADLFTCATQKLVECPSAGTCAQTTHEATNAPAIIYVYLAEKYITGREPSGLVRISEISDARYVGEQLILQGNDLDEEGHLGAAGWTMAIDRDSGRLSMSVSADGVVFAIFGVCEAPPK
jgi:hypothetical protein